LVHQLDIVIETFLKHLEVVCLSQKCEIHSDIRLYWQNLKLIQMDKCIAIRKYGKFFLDGNFKIGSSAFRTTSSQKSKNMIFKCNTTIKIRPNLQIIADDVKCCHGCSVEDQHHKYIHFLISRGLNEILSNKILSYKFGCDILKDSCIKELYDLIKRHLITLYLL